MLRQTFHNALAPLSRCQLAVDVLADLPVQADELSIYSLVGALARSTNQIHHFAKRRLNGHVRRRARARIAMRHRGFLGRLANAHADHCA